MSRKWSDERHLKTVIRRMKEIKEGKARTRFLFGHVAKFRVGNKIYYFSLGHRTLELSAYIGKKRLFVRFLRGKAVERFIGHTADWLRFPNEYVIYKRAKTGRKG